MFSRSTEGLSRPTKPCLAGLAWRNKLNQASTCNLIQRALEPRAKTAFQNRRCVGNDPQKAIEESQETFWLPVEIWKAWDDALVNSGILQA
jgi:hypothetical protein